MTSFNKLLSRKKDRVLTGFTLIELMVVITVITILTVIILPDYKIGGQGFALQRSGYELAQNIRRAQEMAMSAKKFDGTVPFGYGIYLKAGDLNYILYADTVPAGGDQKWGTGDGLVETIEIETGIKIKSVSPASLSINFSPPEPKTKISGTGVPDGTEAVIILAVIDDPLRTKTIRVNRAGLVSID